MKTDTDIEKQIEKKTRLMLSATGITGAKADKAIALAREQRTRRLAQKRTARSDVQLTAAEKARRVMLTSRYIG